VTLDPVRLPETCKYLASLPDGIRSFPKCMVKDVAVDAYVHDFSALASEPGLPEPVAELLRGGVRTTWLPETVFQVTHVVVRELAFPDDRAFFEWVFRANAELFDKPLLRSLMRLLSPGLIVIGAGKRWTTFHQGSDLVPGRVSRSGDREETTARLRYPSGLFTRAFLAGLEHAFLAALVASRAKGPRVELGAVSDGDAEYRVSWHP
jgi:hypothetical protein